ncbi:SEC-C metal-binding domain-containing protein [Ktedonobacter sp. SOSP1-52]|uniref:SEC-C metal-binding domain-containing protein n=1 Tax=Ktedonobacter sp. SOSP1-52 TaxID=2778366 RepID=UPI0035B379D0
MCPCGSGRAFADCCHPLPYWRSVCPNPDMQGYRLLHLQGARFTPVDTQRVHAFLQADERLYCVEETPQRVFWVYWETRPTMRPLRHHLFWRSRTLGARKSGISSRIGGGSSPQCAKISC